MMLYLHRTLVRSSINKHSKPQSGYAIAFNNKIKTPQK